MDPTGSAAGDKAKSTVFRYDRVLPEEAGQGDAYAACARDAVDRFIKGVNVTIFAWVQGGMGWAKLMRR